MPAVISESPPRGRRSVQISGALMHVVMFVSIPLITTEYINKSGGAQFNVKYWPNAPIVTEKHGRVTYLGAPILLGGNSSGTGRNMEGNNSS